MNAFIFSNTVVDVGRKPLPREKVEEVKRLLREGHSCREVSRMTGVSLGKVGEIRKEMETGDERPSKKTKLQSKLHPRYYKEHYGEIWSDPELEPYRPEEFRKLMDKKQSEAEYVGANKHRSVLEGELDDLELELITELRALRDFEAKRARLRKFLERMGFKVEDVYMRRDEVERLVEEERRRAAEEALEEGKRIEALTNIIRDAILKIIDLFGPAVQAFFTPEKESGRQAAQSISTPEKAESGKVVEAESR